MLSLDPKHLMDEVRDAVTLRNKHLSPINDIVQRIGGRYLRSDQASIDATPENYPYQWLTFVLPQIVYERPTITCESQAGASGDAIAQALTAGLNHWAKTSEIKTTLSDIATQMLTGYAMTVVGLETRGDTGPNDSQGTFTSPTTMPFVEVVPREDVIIDAHAKDIRKARIIGRRLERDIDDLMNDQRYDLTKVPNLSQNMGERENGIEKGPFPSPEPPNDRRRRCTLYELYLPEHRKLITLVEMGQDAGDGVIIRDEDYYGPDDGPFDLWGSYYLPGSIYPLSPLQACWEQFLELQDHATVIDEAASQEKNVVLVDANEQGLEAALQKAGNGDLLPVRNLAGILNVKVGGPTGDSQNYTMGLRDRLDRQMGFSGAQAGKSNNNTATSNDIAQINASTRIDLLRQRFADSLIGVLRKVAWYLFYEESVIFRLTLDDGPAGGRVDATFAGGTQWPGQDGTSVVDFTVGIDVTSMVKVDSALQQKRAQDVMAIVGNVAPMIPQTPWINWKGLFEFVGESLNVKDLHEKILNTQILEMMGVPIGFGAGLGPQPAGMGGPGMPQPMQSAAPRVGGTSPAAMGAGLGRMPSAV